MDTDLLLNEILKNGACLDGIADLKGVPDIAFPQFPYAISIGVALNPQVLSSLFDGPTESYLTEYHRVNSILSYMCNEVADYLISEGYDSLVIEPTLDIVLPDLLEGSFPHKTAATRAGLGWIGKCALLITKEFGSAIRLGTVLTNAPLKPGIPVVTSSCGTCDKCQKVCPVQAPSGKLWCPDVKRDDFWDSKACYHYCEMMKQTRNLSSQVCGLCIVSCPYTMNYVRTSLLFSIEER